MVLSMMVTFTVLPGLPSTYMNPPPCEAAHAHGSASYRHATGFVAEGLQQRAQRRAYIADDGPHCAPRHKSFVILAAHTIKGANRYLE